MPPVRRGGTVGSTMATPAAALSRTPPASRPARRDLGVDLALTAVALTITLVTLGQERGPLDADGIALSVLGTLPLIVWRRAPLPVFVVTSAVSVAINARGYDLGLGVAPTVMVFFLARMAPAARPPLTGLAVVVFFFAQVGADYADGTWSPLPIPFLGWLLVWSVGERMRERKERDAARKEEIELDRNLAVARERTRIARDLHDSAGHAINVILVQAGAARLLSERDPVGARAALQAIEDVARDTIDEIDRLVRALRDDEAPAAPRGLAALDALAERHRATGLRVDVEVAGDAHALPAGTDQAAYAIAREALTNAARHGAGPATVRVEHREDGVRLEVTNPTPPGWTAAPEGHGIVGMRERAVLVGGRLSASGGDRAFRVEADLPTGAERP
jgi:signal transduction histidine kinase